jgi:LysM repeat protein
MPADNELISYDPAMQANYLQAPLLIGAADEILLLTDHNQSFATDEKVLISANGSHEYIDGQMDAPSLEKPRKSRILQLANNKKFLIGAGIAGVLSVGVLVFIFAVLPVWGIFKPIDIAEVTESGYGIKINGQTEIVLASVEEAVEVLAELKEYHKNLAPDIVNVNFSATFEENVDIVMTTDPDVKLRSKQEALQDLINGKACTIEHTVTAEETIQKIAEKHSITAESIVAENRDLSIETKLEAGRQIKLIVLQPYLNVIVQGTGEIDEEIEFEIETKKDANVFLFTTEVKQEGEKGSKNVTYAYIVKNGVLIEKNFVEEVTVKEPVKQIVHEGTKTVSLSFNNGINGVPITNSRLASMVGNGEIPKHVASLVLSNNQLTDLSSLQSLKGLTDLNLSNNNITDLTPLYSIVSLRTLTLSQGSLTSDQIRLLREALPGCNITVQL